MRILASTLCLMLCMTVSVHGQQISNNIKTLLSQEGKVLYGNEPNSIVVIDYPENLRRIEDYLAMVDVAPRQVLIEARVVEANLAKEHSLGINWSAFAEKGGGKMGQYRVNSSGSLGSPLEQDLDYFDIYKTLRQSTSGTSSYFTLTIFDDNLTTVLQTLAANVDTELLSAPKITTVNNREAEIKVIQNYPWAEPTVDTSTELAGVVSITWQIHYEEIGIKLKVTPTINDDGRISMVLAPEVSEKVDDLDLEVSGVTYQVPIIDTRSASTKVVVGNGQTLVIGGLVKDKLVDRDNRIPLLGDIPVLGYLFKSKNVYKEKTELLILVSPTIIDPYEVARMKDDYLSGLGKRYAREEEQRKMKTAQNVSRQEASRLKDVEAVEQLLQEQDALRTELLAQQQEMQELVDKKNELESIRKDMEMSAP